MTAVRGKIVGDVGVTVVHLPTPNIKYGDDPNGPPLKRLTPRRHPLNPAPPAKKPPESKHGGDGEQSKAQAHEESRDDRTIARGKIVQDVKISVFHLDEDRISYPKDKGSPLLKRLAPRRPPLNPAPPDEEPQEPKQADKDE